MKQKSNKTGRRTGEMNVFTPAYIKSAVWGYYKFSITPRDKNIKSKRIVTVYCPFPDAARMGVNVHDDEQIARIKLNELEQRFEMLQVRRHVSQAEMTAFYGAVSKNLRSNIDILQTLKKCSGLAKSPFFRGVIGTMCYYISKEGGALSRAMTFFPEAFDETAVAMIEAGENSGETVEVFARLSQAESGNLKMTRRIKGILVYPVILGCAIGSVLMLIQCVVIPKMMPMVSARAK